MTSTQTKTRAQQTRTRAKATTSQAKATGRQAKATAEQAERTLETALRDAGYAWIGVGDVAVELVRNIGKAYLSLPKTVQKTPETLGSFAEVTATTLRNGFDELSDRGRKLTGQISRDPQVREARDQISTAKSRVKAASTSVEKAAEAQTEAVGSAASKVGSATKPKPASKRTASKGTAAKTTARKTTARKTTPSSSSSSASSTPDTGTGPLEDRTVEELYARATELDIDGRSTLSKDELVAAIRDEN